jgi:hypothetical protein
LRKNAQSIISKAQNIRHIDASRNLAGRGLAWWRFCVLRVEACRDRKTKIATGKARRSKFIIIFV